MYRIVFKSSFSFKGIAVYHIYMLYTACCVMQTIFSFKGPAPAEDIAMAEPGIGKFLRPASGQNWSIRGNIYIYIYNISPQRALYFISFWLMFHSSLIKTILAFPIVEWILRPCKPPTWAHEYFMLIWVSNGFTEFVFIFFAPSGL